MSESIYKQKYINYKKKYLQLKKQIGGEQKYLTYSVRMEVKNDLFMNALRNVFNAHNLREISLGDLRNNPKSKKQSMVDIILFYNVIYAMAKDDYSIHCQLRNELDGIDSVINKCKLHMMIYNSNNKQLISHIPKTDYIEHIKKLESNQVLILRPCIGWASSGKGIIRVTSNEQLQKEKNNCQKMKEKNKKYDVIASEYIHNPLLFHGLKYHLRMYLMITLKPLFRHHVFKMGKIITARKPYVDDNFDDNDIHDTHVGSTAHDYFFPNDNDSSNIIQIRQQIEYICQNLAELIKEKIKPYPESTSGFHVFGLDFMVDTDQHVFLIECNENPGYKNIDHDGGEKYKQFIEKYFKWIYKYAIKPFFV